jgi:hypothetical protein
MIFDSILMIRGGSMGFNFDTKLMLSVLALLVCVYDWRVHHRKDYFWVFIAGTIVCASFEIAIQLSGNRDMGDKYLFGLVIPLVVSIPIQAMAEGGFVAIAGIFFGDLLMNRKSRLGGAVVLAIVIVLIVISALAQGLPAPNVGGDVPSRRDIFAPVTLAFMICVVVLNIIWFRKHKGDVRARAAYMLLASVIVFTAWTIGEWVANTRWIEVGTLGVSLVLADPLVTFLALAWDVVVEITLVFMLAFFIPYRLHLIKLDAARPQQVEKV